MLWLFCKYAPAYGKQFVALVVTEEYDLMRERTTPAASAAASFLIAYQPGVFPSRGKSPRLCKEISILPARTDGLSALSGPLDR